MHFHVSRQGDGRQIVFSRGCPFVHMSRSLFWSRTLEVVDGFQPYDTRVIFLIFGVTVLWPAFSAKLQTKITLKLTLVFPALFSKTTGYFKTKLDRGMGFRCRRCAYWDHGTLVHFWGRAIGQNYFEVHILAFLELISTSTGLRTPNLTGGTFRGSRCAFWGNCTLAHIWCRALYQNYFYVSTFVSTAIL